MKKQKVDLYTTFELNNKYYIFLEANAKSTMGMLCEYGRKRSDEERTKKMKLWHSLVNAFGCDSYYAFHYYIKDMKIVDNEHESYRLLQQSYSLEYKLEEDGTLHCGTMLEIEDKETYEFKLLYIKTFRTIRDLAPSDA